MHEICDSLMYLQLRMEAAAALSAVNYTILICSDIIFFFSPSLIFSCKRGIEIVTVER